MNDDLQSGILDSLPIQLGIVPFALVTGIAAAEVGMTPAQAIGMSAIVFAGASQLAAIELLGANAPLAVVVGTAVVINLRMLMYSASIAPHFRQYRRRTRAYLAYFLTDQAYALSIAEYDTERDRDKRSYYLGIGTSLWLVWLAGTVIGVVVGTGVPESWEISFAIPLVFLALLIPAMKDRPRTVAAIGGGAVAVVAADVPFDLGLLVAALAGITAGLLTVRVVDR